MDKVSATLAGLRDYVRPEWRPSQFDAYVGLAAFVLGLVLLGFLVGYLCQKDIKSWYKTLKKPSWSPGPSYWVASSSLGYAIKGYTSWAVWTHGGFESHKIAFGFFYALLALELTWPFLCFKARKLDLALISSITQLGLIASTITAFHPIDLVASYSLIPVSFNLLFGVFHAFALYSLNPQPAKRALYKPLRAIKKLVNAERRKLS